MSKLKYGESGSVYLSQRRGAAGTRYVPPGLFVTMFATMQEPDQYLTEAQSRQGLLRRLMIDYVKTSDLSMDNWKPPLMPDRWQVWQLLKMYIEDLYNRMIQTELLCAPIEDRYDKPAVAIYFDSVREQINKIAKDIDDEIIHDDSDYLIYKQGTWEQLTEISAIHCLARFKPFRGDPSFFSILQEDLDAAQVLHKEISRHSEEVLDNISRPDSRASSQQKDLDRIYRYIYRAGVEGITKTRLGNYAKLLKDKLNEILDTLVGFKRVTMVVVPSGGRKITLYVATELLEAKKEREDRQ